MTDIFDFDDAIGVAKPLEIDVISDVICPWCYIGKRNLDQALVALRKDFTVTVRWRPFELNPDMPREGVDRREYRTQKFGSWEESLARDEKVAAAGLNAGLRFRHDLMLRTPNTIDAHRLIWASQGDGYQDAMVEALFTAYFTQGRDIGDPQVLVDIAAGIGIDGARVAALLDSDLGISEVKAEIGAAYQAGISGVPTVVVNGRPAFSGGYPPDVMITGIKSAAARG